MHRLRTLERLRTADLNSLPKGNHHDGGGLFLRVESKYSSHWVLRFTLNGKRVARGLGPYPLISLHEARQAAIDFRRAARNGRDLAQEKRLARANATTVRQAFKAFFHMKEQQLSNAKHKDQWSTTMETYVFPKIGSLGVGVVRPSDIIKVLEPIWVAKPETAKRVLQRMRAIFDYAITQEWRETDPCRGVVQSLGGTKHRDAKHHRALPYADVPAFIQFLRACPSTAITKLAFEWLILTATRSGEVRGATWSEIDFLRALWVIPAKRMKGNADHIVPLPPHCMRILEEARALVETTGPLIFPGRHGEGPLSEMTFTKVLRDMDMAGKATAHGFRTSFRTWATEVDKCREVVAEAALAHAVRDKTEAAYRRASYVEERVSLMQRWVEFCTGSP